MADVSPHNDKPITQPSHDRFGINPFAETLASSIRKMTAPEGTVIALNGPWGSGKSSAVNLVLHHLKDAIEAKEITVINFVCWWFRGEEALALAFFRELYAGLGPTLGERFKSVLPKLGARLLRAGAMVGSGVDLAGGGGAGAVTSGAMTWLSGLIQADDTVEKLHTELTKALSEQQRRFLIVIDDVDRLAPDEALLIFRLVKSVGRLPNVIYLLAFDRQLAEAIVAERYPTEGPHYLEKIIQAGFDIPEPRPTELRQQLLHQINTICGSSNLDDGVRFMNVFYDVVAPEIKTPRDLIRLTNTLSVTWPAVGAEVNRADFVGLETLRLLRPSVYRAVRSNKERLCGAGEGLGRPSQQDLEKQYDRALLGESGPADQERLRRALMRLFPRLEAVWNGMSYSEAFVETWSRERRVCAREHFESYFRFSLGDDVLPRHEVDELIARASEQDFVTNTFRHALTVHRSNGATKAALLLDELNLHADKVRDEDVENLLIALFKLGDELNVEADAAGPFETGNNKLRIHWLLRSLTTKRFYLAKRSDVFMKACQSAALGWLADFSRSAYRDHHPGEGKSEDESNWLTTARDAEKLRLQALERLRAASESGELAEHYELRVLLFRWRDFAQDDGAEVKQWTGIQIDKDHMVVKLAKAFTSYSWSQSMGDLVAQRNTRAVVDALDAIMNKARFRARAEELGARENLSSTDAQTIREFLDAWKRHDIDPSD